MVSQVRDGVSQRAVARSCRVSLSTVQRWVARAGNLPLDEVDWVARAAGCRVSPQRTKAAVEQRVLVIRRQLRTKSDLGEYGPKAIQREMQQRSERAIPSVATIARILSRRGALDGRKRVRRQAPPPEWDALIEEKVAGCEVLLVFLSQAAVESKWVRREIKFADSENRPILGVRLENSLELKHGLKVVMNQFQMIDASDADFSDELNKAMKYVRLL